MILHKAIIILLPVSLWAQILSLSQEAGARLLVLRQVLALQSCTNLVNAHRQLLEGPIVQEAVRYPVEVSLLAAPVQPGRYVSLLMVIAAVQMV